MTKDEALKMIKELKEYAEENYCKNDCDNCDYLDGDCCRLIYEEKEKKYE